MHLERARKSMKNLLVALGALHSNNIIHKQISSRNVVYDCKNCIKLLNSSFDKGLDDLNDREPFDPSSEKRDEYVTPQGWQSPESTTNEFFVFDENDDVWCLGRTFLEVYLYKLMLDDLWSRNCS
jgi:serine/threonine protein kinase